MLRRLRWNIVLRVQREAGAAGCAQEEAHVLPQAQILDISVDAIDGSRPVSPISLGENGIPLSGMISDPVLVFDSRTVFPPVSTS